MTAADKIEKEARDRAALEAGRWLVALEESPDDADLRSRFEAWVSASPQNAAAWVDTTDVYDLMARTPPTLRARWGPHVAENQENGRSVARRRTGRRTGRRPPSPLPRRGRGRRIALGMAAGVLAAIVIVVAAPMLLLRIEADHLTSTAELRSVELVDGSRVHLGPDSALAVEFASGERRVRLLKGQAFFEVTSDPERPFRVVARDLSAEVLGTAFDLRLGERGASVAVRRGRVGVDREDAEEPVAQQLGAGDWLQVGWDGGFQRGTAPPDEAGAWLQGQMVVRDRPLADAVEELSRYHSAFILLTDSALGARRVSGVYNLDEPEEALVAMAGAHGAVVRRLSPWLLLVSAE